MTDVGWWSALSSVICHPSACYSPGMEGIITAWGPHSPRLQPSLSIEITRECPLRCPGCYAYGDEHLGGDVTLRRGPRLQRSGAGRSAHGPRRRAAAASRVDRRRRAARPVPRAGVILPRCRERGHLHAARHERGPSDSRRMGHHPAAADRRLDRRPPARTRRATHARDLRPHPEAHRGHQIIVHCTVTRQQVQPRRLSRGVRPLLVRARRRRADLVQSVYAAGRRIVRREARPGIASALSPI